MLIWRGHGLPAQICFGLSALLIVGASMRPVSLIPVYRAWMALALRLSKIMTPIVMGIVYFIIVTPIGMVMKMIRGNSMVHSAGENGYWFTKTEDASANDMRRQF